MSIKEKFELAEKEIKSLTEGRPFQNKDVESDEKVQNLQERTEGQTQDC